MEEQSSARLAPWVRVPVEHKPSAVGTRLERANYQEAFGASIAMQNVSLNDTG